jgi:KUP system potassium uptake protein
MSRVPSAYANPFYLTVPPGMLYPSLVVAILACIVASQAVVTGSFQVCQGPDGSEQAINIH